MAFSRYARYISYLRLHVLPIVTGFDGVQRDSIGDGDHPNQVRRYIRYIRYIRLHTWHTLHAWHTLL